MKVSELIQLQSLQWKCRENSLYAIQISQKNIALIICPNLVLVYQCMDTQHVSCMKQLRVQTFTNRQKMRITSEIINQSPPKLAESLALSRKSFEILPAATYSFIKAELNELVKLRPRICPIHQPSHQESIDFSTSSCVSSSD